MIGLGEVITIFTAVGAFRVSYCNHYRLPRHRKRAGEDKEYIH